TGVTGHGGLDRRVQSQNVGLVGNVVDQAHDVTDLLGRLTQALDPLGGVLDLLADRVHAGDGALYNLIGLVGDGCRALRYRGGLGGVGRYLVDGRGPLLPRGGGAGDFLALLLGRLGTVHGRPLGFLGGAGHLQGGVVDRFHQCPQLVDGVVDGVGDGTGEVLGYRGLGRQVTVREVGDLVQQTQNRGLVTLVGGSGLRQADPGFAGQLQTDQQNRAQRYRRQHITQQGVDPAARAALLERLRQVGNVVQQLLGVGEDAVGRGPYLVQLGGGQQDLLDGFGYVAEQVGDLFQTAHRVGIGHPGDAEHFVAVDHAIQNAAKQGRVTTEAVRRHHRVGVTGQYPVHRAENTLGEQRLALGQGYLGSTRATVDEHVHHVLILHLQLRHGVGQLGSQIVQRQYRFLTAEDGVGVGTHPVPVGTGRLQRLVQRARGGRQAGLVPTVRQVAPALFIVV